MTIQQIQEAFIPIIDRLWEKSGDLSDLNNRLSAQRESLIYIEAVVEWIETQWGKGEEVSAKSINEILDPLTIIGSQWFCDPDGEYPYIWRELYYLCNRESDNPVDGYFKIMVILPEDNNPSPSVHIFFPETAEGAPKLYFANYADRTTDGADYVRQEVIEFDKHQWNPRHDDIPLGAFLGKDIVDKMLQYDIMYLEFQGSPGITEIAMMPLSSFHYSYDVVTPDSDD